ncbi:ABCC4.2 family protein [Megaselia abdita]
MNRNKHNLSRVDNRMENSNFISKWTFWWTKNVFKKSREKPLEADNLYSNPNSLSSLRLTEEFYTPWEKEKLKKKPSVLKLLLSVYGKQYISACVIYSIWEMILRALQPLFLGWLVDYFVEGQSTTTKYQAYIYASGIVTCSLLGTLIMHPFLFYLFEFGTKVRLGLSGLIYKKCLKISQVETNDGLNSMAINILSNDLSMVDLAFYFFHDLWKGPIEACVYSYLMYREIGWSALIGLALLIIFIPLQGWVAKLSASFRSKIASSTDARIKLMNEIIKGIQAIKLYSWENYFTKLVNEIREKEITAVKRSMYIYSALQCTSIISKFSIFLSLISYAFLGDVFTAKKVFTVSSYFNILNDSLLNFWPLAITSWSTAYISLKRTQEFLLKEEEKIEICNDEFNDHDPGLVHHPEAVTKIIDFKSVTANWDPSKNPSSAALKDIYLKIKDKELLGVIGPVGSGKSSLLNAMLGELYIANGHLSVNGKISYASQELWLFTGTVKDNIIFTEGFDSERYQQVIRVCGLDKDLQLMPKGDETIIGERGVSLSGGQKARINLARAVYKKADIYLLDDPLSAVDTNVGKHIFEKCIQKFLADKICVLVTHQIQYLKRENHLILMNHGEVEVEGSYEKVKSSGKLRYLDDLEEEKNLARSLSRNASIIDDKKAKDSEDFIEDDDTSETQKIGSVKLGVYKKYFGFLGSPLILLLIGLLFLLSRGLLTGIDYFVSRWAIWEESVSNGNNPIETKFYESLPPDEKRMKIIIFYTIALFLALVLYLLRTFSFFMACLKISLKIHENLYHGISRTFMYFFNTNPSGRILNRFSKDIGTIDLILPQTMMFSASFIVDSASVIIIVAVANYWLLIPALIMMVILYFIRLIYISASRSLKRIESVCRSPVYSHTNQTFEGLSTIRALKAEITLENEFHEYQDAHTSALFLFTAVNRAFAYWTDLICVFYIAAVVYSFLILQKNFYSGDVGLAITQSMTMVIMCQWGMRQTAELENQMTSVERVLEYVDLPSEEASNPEATKLQIPPPNWPQCGNIKFSDLKFKYSDKSNFVLKGINLSIDSSSKIGIVGRTGAGKSSIIQSIFRLALNEGEIAIDNLDISRISLHDLRSKISIIPQDPVLFSGSLRFNLDPANEKPDELLWRALEDVNLKQHVRDMPGGLNSRVYDSGSNFSMGQRQLLCLARAILRNNNILILDEATANVDPETDHLIQTTIRQKFRNCTVLTIAHRLQTIMDNDKVIVMDSGKIVESGQPYELLQISEGHLKKLVDKTGKSTAAFLTKIALESYNKKNQ